jgi:HSP20 family protein
MMRNFWEEVERMHDEMDNLYRTMYGAPTKKQITGPAMLQQMRTPCCNMGWEKDQLVAQFELPGVEKKDIQLNVGDGFLEVKVDQKQEMEKSEGENHQHFSSSRSFYRQVPLPDNADPEKADAEFKNGLLKITMPKREQVEDKTKRLEIK